MIRKYPELDLPNTAGLALLGSYIGNRIQRRKSFWNSALRVGQKWIPKIQQGIALGRMAYNAYRSSTSNSLAWAGARSTGAFGGAGGAMLAASSYRIRRKRRVPRRVWRHRKRLRAKRRRFARKVRRIAGPKNPPKWHIYRGTSLITQGTPLGTTATGQTTIDIGHGTSSHYDGLVMLQTVAKQNVNVTAVGPPPTFEPYMADQFLHVTKSHMVLFITNNSSTAVYGKMAVCKPRKHINSGNMFPGTLAQADLANKSYVGNEWNLPNSMYGATTYADYGGMTDLVIPTGIADIGWVWHNSPSFRRYYKAKIRTVNWAPMECKKFIFTMRKRITIDTASEYTAEPATSQVATSAGDTPFTVTNPLSWAISARDTGFAEMHARRGFYVSFLVHGIPARNAADNAIGLTQPNLDVYWYNAYKYGWSALNKREFHVSSPNPLSAITANVAIPGFGSGAGQIQVG